VYRRWLDHWTAANFDVWTWSRSGGKALNDCVSFYIERDYSKIGVGDILVADGHVLNFEVIHPWTGKPKRMPLILWMDMKSSYPLGWEIMPTENTAAISSALRHAIIRLGKLPLLAYLDNGRAFKARFFSGTDFDQAGFAGLYERLGMKTIHAWPYHGQSKTVERFFGTFAELERWCPTYTGTSIENKPPRMNRGERLHRAIWDKQFGNYALTIEEAHLAIGTWFDEYVRRPQSASSHLAGATPLEVFSAGAGPGVDRAILNHLMMAVEVRTIQRNGVALFGRNYYHPALYGRRHPVTVRYDLQDPTSVLVYDQDGAYLCEAATMPKVHPAAELLGDERDAAELRSQIELKRHLEKTTTLSARRFAREEVIPAYQQQLAAAGIGGNVIALPGAQTSNLTPQTAAEIEERAERITVDPDAIWEKLPGLADPDRYEEDLRLEAEGRELPPDEKTFMRFFEDSEYYESHKEYFQDRRVNYLLAAGAAE
jgi:putative transposase